MPRPLRIDFELRGKGWALISLKDGITSAQIYASYLTDALGDLVDATAAVVEGQLESRFSFDDEPTEYRWLLVRHEARVTVEVLSFARRGEAQPDHAGRLVAVLRLPVGVLGRQILQLADELFDRHGEDGYVELWGRFPYPRDAVERLRDALQAHGRR